MFSLFDSFSRPLVISDVQLYLRELKSFARILESKIQQKKFHRFFCYSISCDGGTESIACFLQPLGQNLAWKRYVLNKFFISISYTLGSILSFDPVF